MNFIKAVLSHDTVVRALKTFVQAAVAVVLVADQPLSKEVAIAAVAAGVSAVWNTVKSRL